MRVAVLGAGVVGIATAWELLRDGHEVVVVDRRVEPAMETSFANAGMVAPGHAFVWSSPQAPKVLLKSLFRDDQSFRFRFQADPRFWQWCWKFLRQCTEARALANTSRKVELCLYSQDRLHGVVAETGIRYGGRTGGAVYVFRTGESFAKGRAHARILQERGVRIEALTPAQAAAVDPVYAPVVDRFAGALYAPGDESGDARLFTLGLAERLRERGAELRLGEPVTHWEVEAGRLHAVTTPAGRITADAFVLAFGPYAAVEGRKLGLDLPIWPVKGYSVTIPVAGRNNPPTLSGVDEDNLFAFANFGDRVRLTAVAEFTGFDWSHRPEDFSGLLKAAKDLFPDAGDYAQPGYWAGLRPMTPDNLPRFGRGALENLWVNAGHGHMGWTWACGSARITADLIRGATPAIDVKPMLVGRA
jgi:D-amino-acid dehydrogenase